MVREDENEGGEAKHPQTLKEDTKGDALHFPAGLLGPQHGDQDTYCLHPYMHDAPGACMTSPDAALWRRGYLVII